VDGVSLHRSPVDRKPNETMAYVAISGEGKRFENAWLKMCPRRQGLAYPRECAGWPHEGLAKKVLVKIFLDCFASCRCSS